MMSLTRGAAGLSVVFAVSFAALLYLSRPVSHAPSNQAAAANATLPASGPDAATHAVLLDEPASVTQSVTEAAEPVLATTSEDSDAVPSQQQPAEQIDPRDETERELAAASSSESVDALVRVLRSNQDLQKRSRALDSLRSIAERDSHNSFVRAALDDARHDPDPNLAKLAEAAYESLNRTD
jgi:hypothetical protein